MELVFCSFANAIKVELLGIISKTGAASRGCNWYEPSQNKTGRNIVMKPVARATKIMQMESRVTQSYAILRVYYTLHTDAD